MKKSESFLKCFEAIAEDKSCILADSVLYLSGKPGKGFVTVAGLAAGIEVLAVNASMLTEDLVFNSLPSRGESTYILCFDEIDPTVKTDQEGVAPSGAASAEGTQSMVSITDLAYGKVITYPKDKVIRSLVVRVRKTGLEHLIQDFDAGTIQSILESTGNEHSLSWPITFKYRLLLEDFMTEIVQHPFRELFTIRNISILVEYLLQQFFVMDKLSRDGNALSIQDTHSLSRVEQYLCLHYKKEFPGIEKCLYLGDEPHQSEDQVQEILRRNVIRILPEEQAGACPEAVGQQGAGESSGDRDRIFQSFPFHAGFQEGVWLFSLALSESALAHSSARSPGRTEANCTP